MPHTSTMQQFMNLKDECEYTYNKLNDVYDKYMFNMTK